MDIKNSFLVLLLLLFSLNVFSQKGKNIAIPTPDTIKHQLDSLRELSNPKEIKINELTKNNTALGNEVKKLKDKVEKLDKENSTDWTTIFEYLMGLTALIYLLLQYKIITKIINYFKGKNEKELIVTDETENQLIPLKNGPENKLGEVIDKEKPNTRKDKIENLSNANWYVVGQSVIGKSHIENNTLCQDNHFIEDFGGNWGIAISCDGAGSAKYSHLGSKFVSERSAIIFRAIIEKNKFDKQNHLPPKENWQELSKQGLYQVYKDLEVYSKKEGLRLEGLACTVIIVIYTPFGYLVTHIGDGRAGYLNEQKEWKAMMTPWKGEEANQTVFITSSIWNEKIDSFIESNVIEEKSTAFTLMSDGCENHSFECSKINPETQEWIDLNLPYPKFFNPLVHTLNQSLKEGISHEEIKEKWTNFITSGNEGLKNESDDKTLILGILQPVE